MAQVKGGNGADWVGVDAKEMPKELSKKEDNKGGGGRSKRKRVKSEEGKVSQEEQENNVFQQEGDDDNKDREMVEDETLESGYSSGEKDDTNVIYYKVFVCFIQKPSYLVLKTLIFITRCYLQTTNHNQSSDQQHFLVFTLLDRQPVGGRRILCAFLQVAKILEFVLKNVLQVFLSLPII